MGVARVMFFGILSCGLMLLLAAKIHVHSFTPEDEQSQPSDAIDKNLGKRKLLGLSQNEEPLFRASLVRHRIENATRMERFSEAVKRSKARAKALAAAMDSSSSSTKKTISATNFDYQSPVASISGAYTMQIQLGTPPQKFNAIVDTGSDLVWIQCRPCSQCYTQNDPIFNPASSSSFQKTSCTTNSCQSLPVSGCSKKGNTCIYGYQYGDSSSTQGDFALETLTLHSPDGSSKGFPNFQFGCGRLNSGSFGGAAGIVGLGQGKISLATQLGSAIGNTFSYCLVDFDDDSSKTSPLILGAPSNSKSGASITTPIIPNSGRSTYYFVGLESISVGGKSLGLATKEISFLRRTGKDNSKRLRSRALEVNSGGTIFDSGTTLTLLDDSVYDKVKSAFSSSISLPTVDGSGSGFDLCYDVSSNKKYKFPSLTLGFKGASFSPAQGNYFVLVDTSETIACLAMAGSGSLGLGIIGNLMQQNYHVTYDRSALTISMSPAKCDSL